MLFEQAEEFILNKLRTQLPAQFTYHNADHALDVHDAAGQIARQENIASEQVQLLLTAALYHDAGFLTGPEGHEERSCHIAAALLPGFNYSVDDINTICGLIRATKMPQAPLNHLEQILADADLDYLGRQDFWEISNRLYEELLLGGKIGSKQEWDLTQITFMEEHRYFTRTAIDTRQKQKEANIAVIKAEINNK